jgi:hypothetical protein
MQGDAPHDSERTTTLFIVGIVVLGLLVMIAHGAHSLGVTDGEIRCMDRQAEASRRASVAAWSLWRDAGDASRRAPQNRWWETDAGMPDASRGTR